MIQSLHLTMQEAHILDVAAKIQFGEIYDAEVHCKEPTMLQDVTDGQKRFVDMVREEGWVCISKIVVHNGEPAIVEIDGEDAGLTYKIKRKI
jgi:hypothetical protein